MIIKLVTSFWFRAFLSGTVLAYLLTQLDHLEAARVLTTVDLRYFLGALMVDLAARATMISRWVLLLRSIAVPIPAWSVARIFFITSFVGTALPTGGADVTRAYALSQHTHAPREALASVLVDRLLGLSALLVLGVAGLTLWTREVELPLTSVVVALIFAASVTVLCTFWADRILRKSLPMLLQNTRLGQCLILVADGVGHYRGQRGVLVIVFGLSLMVQWLRILEVFLLGSGLHLDVGLSYYLLIMPVGLLILMLPISIAGIGLPQGVLVWLLRPVGVLDAESFALSTLVIIIGLLGTLPGLWLYLRSRIL